MHHKILTRLISNHSDIQAHFIARFDYVNFKLLLSAQIERLVQIKFRRIYRCVNLKPRPRSIWAQRCLVYTAPRLDKITTFTQQCLVYATIKFCEISAKFYR